jgi:hypothetical protein
MSDLRGDILPKFVEDGDASFSTSSGKTHKTFWAL